MRNQSKYDVLLRKLNEEEKEILREVENKSGIKFHVVNVQYRRHVPRATICVITRRRWLIFDQYLLGVSIRSRTDAEVPEVGRKTSFRRALEDYAEWKKTIVRHNKWKKT